MNVEIAQRLATMRREKGYSQEALAEKLGLSRQAISKWERAESQPDTGNLIALADLYEVALDELIRVDVDIADDVRFENHVQDVRDEIAEAEGAAEVVTATATAETIDQAVIAEAAEAAVAGQGAAGSSEPAFATPVPEPTSMPMPESPAHVHGAHKPPKSPYLTFPYPVLVVVVYLFLGFAFGLWHPAWIIFFTIPFYYWIVKVITDDPDYQAWRAERWR